MLKFNDGVVGRRGADAATYFLQRVLRRAAGLFWQPARVTTYARAVLLAGVAGSAAPI